MGKYEVCMKEMQVGREGGRWIEGSGMSKPSVVGTFATEDEARVMYDTITPECGDDDGYDYEEVQILYWGENGCEMVASRRPMRTMMLLDELRHGPKDDSIYSNVFADTRGELRPVTGVARGYDGYALTVVTHDDVYDDDGELVDDLFDTELHEFRTAEELEEFCRDNELVASKDAASRMDWVDGTWFAIVAEQVGELRVTTGFDPVDGPTIEEAAEQFVAEALREDEPLPYEVCVECKVLDTYTHEVTDDGERPSVTSCHATEEEAREMYGAIRPACKGDDERVRFDVVSLVRWSRDMNDERHGETIATTADGDWEVQIREMFAVRMDDGTWEDIDDADKPSLSLRFASKRCAEECVRNLQVSDKSCHEGIAYQEAHLVRHGAKPEDTKVYEPYVAYAFRKGEWEWPEKVVDSYESLQDGYAPVVVDGEHEGYTLLLKPEGKGVIRHEFNSDRQMEAYCRRHHLVARDGDYTVNEWHDRTHHTQLTVRAVRAEDVSR